MKLKFKDYVKNLNKFLADHPDASDYYVVIADHNDEYGPDVLTDRKPYLGFFEPGKFDGDSIKVNAVCVN